MYVYERRPETVRHLIEASTGRPDLQAELTPSRQSAWRVANCPTARKAKGHTTSDKDNPPVLPQRASLIAPASRNSVSQLKSRRFLQNHRSSYEGVREIIGSYNAECSSFDEWRRRMEWGSKDRIAVLRVDDKEKL